MGAFRAQGFGGWGLHLPLCHQLLINDPIGTGSGVPFHWHGPGFSEVIYGRKVSPGWWLRVGAQ